MVNDGGGDVGEREPVGAPAIAELLVLGGRARNGRRETADGAKQVGCEREVVRREERLARASGAIVFVDELLDLLAGRRIGIFGKRVLDAPAEQPAIVQFDLAHEGGERPREPRPGDARFRRPDATGADRPRVPHGTGRRRRAASWRGPRARDRRDGGMPRGRHRIGAEVLPGAGRTVAHIRERADTAFHPVGTCRLGEDADAVADPWLRVPSPVAGNAQAAVLAIVERAADSAPSRLSFRPTSRPGDH